MKPKVPRAVVAGLVVAVALDTFVQIAWKVSVGSAPDTASPAAIARLVLASPWFYAAMAGLIVQLINWVRVLARADLSYAQPFTALSYVGVLAISAVELHERISPGKVFGVSLILVGVFFISRTPSRTAAAAPPSKS